MSDKWSIVQTDFDSKKINKHMESLFTLGNGFLGIRGDSILSDTVYQRGTYINGFYESGPITYGEKAYGYAENWQTIIPLPEGKEVNITVDGTKLFNKLGFFKEQKRTLNLKEATVLWEFLWCDEEGKNYKGSVKSLIPLHHKGTVLFIWNLILPENHSSVTIDSSLKSEFKVDADSDDPRLPGHFKGSSLKIGCEKSESGINILTVEAEGSGLVLKCAMDHSLVGFNNHHRISDDYGNGLFESIIGTSGKTISFVKTLSYSFEEKDKSAAIGDSIIQQLAEAKSEGVDKILIQQKQYMDRFWDNSDVELEGDDDVQLSLRYNLFQLLQSTGRDGKRSIAAKGLSGSGYEGHYFWDAETYVLPFFIYTNPEIARSMLMYRISIMDKARERAELLGHKGILFPWRTINGEESSAYFPAGTAQYHINSDIALGLVKYLEVTGDVSILNEGGDQLLAQTARFWCDLGSYIKGKGFCFNSVTGPDEYTALVDNNYYTNLSAKKNLLASAKWLKQTFSDTEIKLWEKTAEEIYLPQIGAVTPQDDSFFSKEPWDFASTKEDQYPLLLHFHPLNIYRKQVLKQADVIMAQSLYRSELPPEQMKRNFDYYEQLTTGDSSLSACAQGINALWFGYEELAWEYLNETVHTDRKDLHKNVFHGLHTASMGGSYLMILNGFLGLENYKDTVRFRPGLPEKITGLTQKITIRKNRLKIVVNQNEIQYTALENDIDFYHYSKKINLQKGQSVLLPIKPEIKLTLKGLDEKVAIIKAQVSDCLPEETDIYPFNRKIHFSGFRPRK